MVDVAADALAEPVAPVPAAEPPSRDLTPRQWVRANLFSTPANGALTVLFGLLGGYLLYRLLRYVFVTAEWAIVRVNLRLFMVGQFPSDQFWRLWASVWILAATIGIAGGMLLAAADERRIQAGATPEDDDEVERDRNVLSLLRRFWPLVLGVVVVLSFTRTFLPTLLTIVLVALFLVGRLVGGHIPARLRTFGWGLVVVGLLASVLVITAGPEGVGWDEWGGVHLAVAATIAGICLAFPLGLVLALGRRSSLQAIRALSVGYIELFRAVPLVTLLFIGQFMIGFLFPTQVEPPSDLVRAVIAITLFEAAYIAEIVRGGLQAVPRGQVEAALAVGLSQPKVLRLVVLPQALRAVIPAMVGQFISLFKDTSLLSIIGFLEILDASELATTQDQFRGQGLQVLTYLFAGFLYWTGCSTMARESQRLERRLRVGAAR